MKTKIKQSKKWYKILPFIPILGIFFTFVYSEKFGGIKMEDDIVGWLTAIMHATSICVATYIILLYIK